MIIVKHTRSLLFAEFYGVRVSFNLGVMESLEEQDENWTEIPIVLCVTKSYISLANSEIKDFRPNPRLISKIQNMARFSSRKTAWTPAMHEFRAWGGNLNSICRACLSYGDKERDPPHPLLFRALLETPY